MTDPTRISDDQHNNAPAVPQGYPVLPDYVEDAIERCKNMPGHPPAWVDMMRSMRKALGAATPSPAPARGEPFGYFRSEPFGWTDCSEDADGAIALYEHPAKPAQEVGLTDEEIEAIAKKHMSTVGDHWSNEEAIREIHAEDFARDIIAALRAKESK